jgi:surface protein
MKKILSITASLAMYATAFSINIIPGWQLEGTSVDINISVFNNSKIKSVWTWDKANKRWKAYVPNKNLNLEQYGIEKLNKINKNDGFWVYALDNTTLNIDTNQTSALNCYDNASEILIISKPNQKINIDLAKVKTIKCPNLLPGDKFYINNIEYDVVDNNSIQDRKDYEHICTTHVTDMHSLFYDATDFDQNISKWDVSNVSNMSYMFYGAKSFNQPLNNWDVSNVSNMSYMFYGAASFNQDISDWNVSNVVDYSDFADNCPIDGTNKMPKFKNK